MDKKADDCLRHFSALPSCDFHNFISEISLFLISTYTRDGGPICADYTRLVVFYHFQRTAGYPVWSFYLPGSFRKRSCLIVYVFTHRTVSARPILILMFWRFVASSTIVVGAVLPMLGSRLLTRSEVPLFAASVRARPAARAHRKGDEVNCMRYGFARITHEDRLLISSRLWPDRELRLPFRGARSLRSLCSRDCDSSVQIVWAWTFDCPHCSQQKGSRLNTSPLTVSRFSLRSNLAVRPPRFELAETVRACDSLRFPFRAVTRLLKSARLETRFCRLAPLAGQNQKYPPSPI